MSFPLSSNMFITPSLLVPPSDSLLTWCHGPRWDSAWRETACHVTQVINELWTSGQSKLPPNKRGQHKREPKQPNPCLSPQHFTMSSLTVKTAAETFVKRMVYFQWHHTWIILADIQKKTVHLSIVNKQQINTEQQKLKRIDMANHIKVGGVPVHRSRPRIPAERIS